MRTVNNQAELARRSGADRQAAGLIAAGYMYKKIVAAPDWVEAAPGTHVYSLSACISDDFTDYIPYWRHNGYWLFNSPEALRSVAAETGIDTAGLSLLYYEVHEEEYDGEKRRWAPFTPNPAFPTSVCPPSAKHLLGYDVVTFSCGTSPECSPLSCNALAGPASANRYCLLDSLQAARDSLASGVFDGSEPGPFRIFSVYSVSELPAAYQGDEAERPPLL